MGKGLKKSKAGRGKRGPSQAEQERLREIGAKYDELINRDKTPDPPRKPLVPTQLESPAEFLEDLQSKPPESITAALAARCEALAMTEEEAWAWRGMVTEIGKQCEKSQMEFIELSARGGLTMYRMVEYQEALQQTRAQLEEAAIANERRRQIASSVFWASDRKGQKGTPSWRKLHAALNVAERRSMDLAADAKRFNIILHHYKLSPAYRALMKEMREKTMVSPGGHVVIKPTLEEIGTDESFDSLLAELKNESGTTLSEGSESDELEKRSGNHAEAGRDYSETLVY